MITFNQPALMGTELEHMRAAVLGGHTSAKGPYTERVTEILRDELGVVEALLTTSCTASLELSAMLLDLQPGDRVIVPSFTFVSTALAFAREGAEVVFADIEPNTLGIDPAHVAELVDERTRAIVLVHYAGVPCRLDALQTVLGDHPHVAMIEDNAHGLFATHRDKPLGSFGRFATLSFHETKNLYCGEGGALLLNDARDVERAHVLYDKGTNRRAFMLGEVDKYSWVDTGASFGMSDLLAAFLFGQFEARTRIMERRRDVFEHYERCLAPHADGLGFRTPTIPPDATCGYHMFYLLVDSRETRDHLLTTLMDNGFKATFHYIPLHDARGADRRRAYTTACPVTTDVSGRLIRLPFFNDLRREDIERISECVLETLDARVS